jgi:MIP family channel proteins
MSEPVAPTLKQRLIAEFIGTFAIVFAPVAVSAGARFPGGDATLATAAWASGLSVLAMIYALGPVCKAHFNPAVTLGFAFGGYFARRDVLPYIAAQLAGSLAAAFMVVALFGASGAGVHVPAPALFPFRAIFTEATLTFVLMLVILAVATDKRVSPVVPAIAIGLTVVVLVFIGGPFTGGSMNPARSFGPALVAGGAPLAAVWVYLFGPCMGSVGAARVHELLRGKELIASDVSKTF